MVTDHSHFDIGGFDLEFLTDFGEFDFVDMTIYDLEQLYPSLGVEELNGRCPPTRPRRHDVLSINVDSFPLPASIGSPKRRLSDANIVPSQSAEKKPAIEISNIYVEQSSSVLISDEVVPIVIVESPNLRQIPKGADSEAKTEKNVADLPSCDQSVNEADKPALEASTPIQNVAPTIVKKNSDDEVVGYTDQLIKAFNVGDLGECNNVIDRFCALNMLIRTPFSSADLCGRHHFKEIHVAILADRPDTVYEVKYSKLLRDKRTEERYLAVKLEFSQTRCGFTKDMLDKLDEVYRRELLKALKADATVEERQRAYVEHKIPYSAKGVKWFRYSIAENNELLECSITRKFTSVEPFDVSEV